VCSVAATNADESKQGAARGRPRENIYLGLVEGNNYGWGVCSRYLIQELSKLTNCWVLNEADGSAHNGNLEGKLFQALTGVDFFSMFEHARARQNFGYTFFENELTRHSLENAKRYDLILGGSSWCRDRLVERGISNCGVLIQGIDPNLFYPIEEGRDESERFVLFSGGKFELRKGQDLVLKAVKILQDRYPDIWLVNCWYNIWPESMRLMTHSPHIRFEMHPGAWQDLMVRTYAANGLDPARIVTCDLMPAGLQRELYLNTDIGVFPNRCEGGTNLVLMEYMACGKPVIASYTSGHMDVVNEENALLLKQLRDYTIVGPDRKPFARWQEPSVDELVAQIERAYHHRDDIRRRGQKAGKDMQGFTWKRSAERLIELLS
jgi:glycosyltransferase involved in cell wall biosynthesis